MRHDFYPLKIDFHGRQDYVLGSQDSRTVTERSLPRIFIEWFLY